VVSFYAFPVIFIDTVLFKKGSLIKSSGVRTPWTPPGYPLLHTQTVWKLDCLETPGSFDISYTYEIYVYRLVLLGTFVASNNRV